MDGLAKSSGRRWWCCSTTPSARFPPATITKVSLKVVNPSAARKCPRPSSRNAIPVMPASCAASVWWRSRTVAYKVDPSYGGPEYETLGTFGSYCGINDLAAVSLANQICNEYAVDTIACGATIAFAMECFEKGIITTKETGGTRIQVWRRGCHAHGRSIRSSATRRHSGR